jgi:predicted DNA-binding transcriptional regulator AlpA
VPATLPQPLDDYQGSSVRVVDEVMGLTEVAEYLGITRQRVHQLARSETFPKPIAHLRAGLIWRTVDIELWAEETGRL